MSWQFGRILLYPGGQLLINGLAYGCVIALLTTAYQLVYMPTRVFFLALAGLYAFAPFLAGSAVGLGFGLLSASVIAASGTVLLAVLLELISHSKLDSAGASANTHLIASISHYIVITQAIAIVWGITPRTLRRGLDSVWQIGPAILTGTQRTIVITTVISLSALFVVLRSSELGLRLRALAENPAHFELFGYPVRPYRLVCFGLSGLFGSLASLLSANDVGFDPYSGMAPFLLAVVAAIIVGPRSLIKPVLGAFLLGILRAHVAYVWSSRWQDAVTLAILVAVLFLKPRGLLADASRIEAAS